MRRIIGKPIYKKFRKYIYLSQILGRLQDEVGTALKFYEKHNKRATKNQGRWIGFWSGARLMFPVIESVSKVLGKTKWDFLSQDLGVKPSSLTWQIFRNSLAHGDRLVYAKYKRKIIKWGLIMDKRNHDIGNRKIHIDLLTLYIDLENFLRTEIAKKGTTYVDVQIGIDYTNEKDRRARPIILEIKNL